jgi:hypothetical protein
MENPYPIAEMKLGSILGNASILRLVEGAGAVVERSTQKSTNRFSEEVDP